MPMIGAIVLTIAATTRPPARPQPTATPSVAAPVFVSGSLPDPKDLSSKCQGVTRNEGLPIVEAYIQADGTVRDARVTRSSGCTRGDELLVGAIKKWTYKPALAEGRPVGVWLTVSVTHFWW